MTATTHGQQSPTRSARDRWVARSWTGVALIPVFFLMGFAVGQVAYSVLGYKPENADAPLWVDIIASVFALGVCLIPCIGAVIYGRRASKAGSRSALAPTLLGALAGAALVVLTALSTG